MTNIQDLIDKVEAGAWGDDPNFGEAGEATELFGRALTSQMRRGWYAYHGSLDAAKALHDSVLPGWAWMNGYAVTTGEATAIVSLPHEHNEKWKTISAESECVARAWLLAILKAMKEGN